MAGITLVLAGMGFVTGGIGLFARQSWWRPVVIITSVFSSLIFILFWDGKFNQMPDKGWIGVLINVGILLALLVFHLPSFGF